MGSASAGMEGWLYSLFSIIFFKRRVHHADTHAPLTGVPNPWWKLGGMTLGAKAPGADTLQQHVSSLITIKNTSRKSSHYPTMLPAPHVLSQCNGQGCGQACVQELLAAMPLSSVPIEKGSRAGRTSYGFNFRITSKEIKLCFNLNEKTKCSAVYFMKIDKHKCGIRTAMGTSSFPPANCTLRFFLWLFIWWKQIIFGHFIREKNKPQKLEFAGE